MSITDVGGESIKIAHNLAERRRAAGLSQADVASALNVSRPAVSLWELGINIPRPAKLVELAKLYQCTTDDLLGYTDESLDSSDGVIITHIEGD